MGEGGFSRPTQVRIKTPDLRLQTESGSENQRISGKRIRISDYQGENCSFLMCCYSDMLPTGMLIR